MNFSIFELINVLIAFSLISAIWYSRGNVSLLLVLFCYGTFHFSFSSIALLNRDASQLLIQMHSEGAGILALASGVAVLSVTFGIFTFRAYTLIANKNQIKDRSFFLLIFIALIALLFGYYLNYRENDFGQALNVASISAMLMLVLLASVSPSGSAISINRYALVLIAVLLVVTALAVYEVISHKAWSVFWDSEGVTVYRASSLLFNPNLFAYWASLIYIASVYAWHTESDENHLWVFSMVLAAAAIYMSGSRSALALLFSTLIFSMAFVRSKKSIVACIVLILTVAGIYGVAMVLSTGEPWSTIAVLGERYKMAFAHLCGYLFQFFGLPNDIPPEVAISIEGRFVGEYRDAGWLVLHQDAGWLGILAFLLVSAFVLLRIFRANWQNPGPAGAYATAAVLYCVMSGLVMRFQIFPVWLFFGIVMVIGIKSSRLNNFSPNI